MSGTALAARSGGALRQPGSGARLVEYKPWPQPNPSLLGKASVDFSGWIVHDIPIFRKADGGLSVGWPSAALVDADGQQRRDAKGKRAYWAVITFANNDAKARWERSVLSALEAAGVVP